MRASRKLIVPALLALPVLLAGCGGGGGGAPAPPDTGTNAGGASAVPFARTIVLGRTESEPVGLVEAPGATGSVAIVAPMASTLLSAGSNPVSALYRSSGVAGAVVACVSAPTSSTGLATGINLGVNVKSVAALLDQSWVTSSDPTSAWAQLGAAGAVFDGWENCGAKPEGAPSPSSLRTLAGDGGFAEQVYDGNFSTNLNVLAFHYTAAQVAAMLSPAGYPASTQEGAPRLLHLQILHNQQGQVLLVEQGLPPNGSTSADPGYLAVYFQH